MRFLRRFHPVSILLGVVLTLCAAGVAAPFAISRAEEGESAGSTSRAIGLGSAFTFQGQVQQADTPINSPHDFEFRLFSNAAGTTIVPATPIVTKDDLAVTNGLFTTDLDFGASAFDGEPRWLKVSVREGTSSGPYEDLTPLQTLNPTPYALYSQKTGPHTHLGEVWEDNLGVTPVTFGLDVNADSALALQSNQAGLTAFSFLGDAIVATANAPTKAGVVGENGSRGTGLEGVGTGNSGPVGPRMGVIGRSSPTGDFPNKELLYYGSGVYGESQDWFGVTGFGQYGLYGVGTDTGVFAVGEAGNGVNARGTGKGTEGAGIVADNFGGSCTIAGNLSDYCLGVFGNASGSASVGVWGEGQKFGVFGRVPSCIQGGCAGVVGDKGAGTWAGRFFGPVVIQASGPTPGDLDVQGTLTKAAGAFKIDHPQDPANKFLFHSFIESPDMKNLYDGLVTTGADGFATVELPAYFEALNSDFRYQLTVIGDGSWARARVSKKVENGRFVIETDAPNVEVSWQVTGIRRDAYANDHRTVTEVDKVGDERGQCVYEPACR